jgi:hypothetical protein
MSNVGRDVHIRTEASQPKALSVCTNQELLAERIHRRKLLDQENRKKLKSISILWTFAIVFTCIAALYFYFKGDSSTSSLVLGIGGISTVFYSIKFFEKPTEFEMRQLTALKEIKLILRERGIE